MIRPSPFSLFLTALLLAVLLAPPLVLAFRCWEALRDYPALWGLVSPFSRVSLVLLGHSLSLALGAGVLSLVFGIPAGFSLARGPKWWRPIAACGGAVALSLPPVLVAAPYVGVSWAGGPGLGVLNAPPVNESLGAWALSSLILGQCYFPLVAFSLAAALRAMPSEEEQAAQLLVGEGAIWKVLWPRVAPAALGGALGAAALALWEMGAPDLMGWPSYSMAIYRNFNAVSTPGDALGVPATVAAALTGLPLPILGLGLVFVAAWILGKTPVGNANFSQPTARGGVWANAGLVATVFLLGMCPIYPLWRFARATEGWRATWEVLVANSVELWNTVFMPGVAAMALPILAFGFAALWSQWPVWWRRAALVGAFLPLLLAPIVMAMALIGFWNAEWAAPFHDSTYGMILMGYFARFAPIALALVVLQWQNLDPEILRAAHNLGARPFEAALTIAAPILRPFLAALGALMFALCAGELTVTVLVQEPGAATLPLPIFGMLHFGLAGDVAALCLALATLCGGAMAVAALLFAREMGSS